MAQAIGEIRWPGEALQAYFLRRGGSAVAVVSGVVDWGARVGHLAHALHVRVCAEVPLRTWASLLILVRGEAWLRERRLPLGSGSAYAGRIDARAAPGRVPPRWEPTIVALPDACRSA